MNRPLPYIAAPSHLPCQLRLSVSLALSFCFQFWRTIHLPVLALDRHGISVAVDIRGDRSNPFSSDEAIRDVVIVPVD
jgi:hypothetical protein